MKKQQLKEKDSYYYEQNDWYENCPETLPKSPGFKTVIFPRTMTHKEILETYNIVPYTSYAQAASVTANIIPTLKNDYKSNIIYFKENDVMYRFNAWRFGDGQLLVSVSKVNLDYECGAEDGACLSN